jgi:hypothetical protein
MVKESKQKNIILLDRLIFGSLVLFLLTLTNSIFLNQLGYYAALIFVVARYAVSRENKFRKTGMEVFFIAFIISEIISTILSLNFPLAFNNFLKRILLIPIVYTIIAATDDESKLKLEFKIFIGAAIFSMGIYLFNAYKHYIYNLYSLESSGPSVFQYPITTSEIMSFVVIYLFTFLINERTSLKYRFLNFVLLGIAGLALFSTYKRTGWLGAAVGILMVVVIGRKWKILIPLAIGFAAVLLLSNNKSTLQIYDINGNTLNLKETISTTGRASDVLIDSNCFYLSDFDNGLVKYSKNKSKLKLALPAPVISAAKWNDTTLIANLIDTRFIVINKSNDKLSLGEEFISPGQTNSFLVANNVLYVLDSDSGLTVFKMPNKMNAVRFPELGRYHKMSIDSHYAAFYSLENKLRIYKLKNNLPDKLIYETTPKFPLTGIYLDKILLLSDNQSTAIFKIENDLIEFEGRNNQLKNLFKFSNGKGKLVAVDLTGQVVSIDSGTGDLIKFTPLTKLSYLPGSVNLENLKLYFTYSKVSRLSSIFDIYNPSNFNRFAFWRAGLKIFQDYPIFGVGDIDLAFLYIQYKNEYDKEIQGHMHNNFVHVLVTLGAFGFIIMCALLSKIFLIHLKIYKALKDKPFVSSFALGSAACFIAFIVSGLTELNLFDHEIITLIWFMLGLNLAFYFKMKPAGEKK